MASTATLSSRVMAEAAAPKRSLTWYFLWAFVLMALAGSWQGADMRPLDLVRDSGNMATYAAEFFPPNFSQWRVRRGRDGHSVRPAFCVTDP